MSFLFMMALSWPTHTKSIEFLKDFPLDGQEFLSNPVDACFSPNGSLFIADNTQAKVYAWDKGGNFVKAFGKKGEGPGEMYSPFSLVATNDSVYVWTERRWLTIYDHLGNFEKSIRTNGLNPRSFAVLSPDLLLMGHSSDEGSVVFMNVTLMGLDGKVKGSVLKERNNGFLKVGEGNNNAYIKSYMPEVDLSPGPDGEWYFGFSQTARLHRINTAGEVLGSQNFDLPTSLPDDFDKEIVNTMSFPGPNGQLMTLKDLPDIRMSFANPKAYYTHFQISGDRVAFILTPIGSTDSLNNGYARATYYVCDLNSGKVLSRGHYSFPEESKVYYQNGRAVAVIMGEEDEYQVREIKLKGM